MRTLVDIPADDLKLLNAVVKKLEISRAEFVRQAISASLTPHRKKMNHAGFGVWASEETDGLEYQQRLREEW